MRSTFANHDRAIFGARLLVLRCYPPRIAKSVPNTPVAAAAAVAAVAASHRKAHLDLPALMVSPVTMEDPVNPVAMVKMPHHQHRPITTTIGASIAPMEPRECLDSLALRDHPVKLVSLVNPELGLEAPTVKLDHPDLLVKMDRPVNLANRDNRDPSWIGLEMPDHLALQVPKARLVPTDSPETMAIPVTMVPLASREIPVTMAIQATPDSLDKVAQTVVLVMAAVATTARHLVLLPDIKPAIDNPSLLLWIPLSSYQSSSIQICALCGYLLALRKTEKPIVR